MKIIKEIYNFVVSIQFIMLLVFIVTNVNNITNIPYSIPIYGDISIDFTFNIYLLIPLIGILFVAIITSSIQAVTFGLNDEGTKNIARLVSFTLIWLIMSIGSNYYFNLFSIATLLNLIVTIIHVLNLMIGLSENS